jgi:signal transduction histidine kinase
MTSNQNRDQGAPVQELRRRAEQLLKEGPAGQPSDVEPTRVIHELQVHQVELQLQNEELLRLQRELLAARNRHVNLFDQAPVGFVTLDADGMVRHANRTFCELLDRAVGQLDRRPFRDLVHPEERQLLTARYPAFFRDPRGKALELRLQGSPGVVRVCRIVARRSDPETGAEVLEKNAPAELLVCINDITEMRRMENEKEQLEEQLRHIQKLKSFGLFAGGIAHDFNNLLMSMVGHCDLALWELGPGHAAREHIEQTLKAADHAAEVCRKLLAYAGHGKQEQASHELGALVNDLEEILHVSVNPRIDLVYERQEQEAWAHGDGGQLRQLIANLVSNAGESYGDGKGTVRVRVGTREFSPETLGRSVVPSSLEPGLLPYLEVRDQGAGMDPATRERMFDPFFSTKFTGRGLGMSVVMGIIRSHGGTALVDSEPGRGTTVTVILPAHAPERPDRVLPVTNDHPAELASSRPVLLIDDDEQIRKVGAAMLQNMGLVPLVAEDGPSGLDLFRERKADLACVLLDLMMPGMDGFEVLAALRREDPTCRVVFVTGYHEHDLVSGSNGEQPDAVVLKPFRLRDLQDIMRPLLAD